MIEHTLNYEQALQIARAVIKRAGYGGVKALSEHSGVKPQSIGAQLAGRRPLSPKLLAALGLERARVYRIVGDPVMLDPAPFLWNRKPEPAPLAPNVTVHRLNGKRP